MLPSVAILWLRKVAGGDGAVISDVRHRRCVFSATHGRPRPRIDWGRWTDWIERTLRSRRLLANAVDHRSPRIPRCCAARHAGCIFFSIGSLVTLGYPAELFYVAVKKPIQLKDTRRAYLDRARSHLCCCPGLAAHCMWDSTAIRTRGCTRRSRLRAKHGRT